MMDREDFEALVEDEEMHHHVLPTLGKCSRDSPSTLDESTSNERIRTMGVHLTHPGYLSLVLGVPDPM
ncbi:hypothetical protein KI387_040126, partial [Taxus chinensis]